MANYLGDIVAGQILYTAFTTVDNSGVPTTAVDLAISVYKNDSDTESTAGITTTFTGGFDGRAGLVNVKVDTSADETFYASGNDFHVVVTAGTVDGSSIVGYVVAEFSIYNRNQKVNVTKFGGTTVEGLSSITEAILASAVETGLTVKQALQLCSAVLVGLSSGFPDNTKIFKSADIVEGTINGDKPRVTATTDPEGNRTAITVDLT